mmetsp:Transcript_20887/g.46790  ORF Transcript_20887/g.46790 Transcript_20887/m.46790 type:complete len:244 (+) Transcript_20887:540-1271(+)
MSILLNSDDPKLFLELDKQLQILLGAIFKEELLERIDRLARDSGVQRVSVVKLPAKSDRRDRVDLDRSRLPRLGLVNGLSVDLKPDDTPNIEVCLQPGLRVFVPTMLDADRRALLQHAFLNYHPHQDRIAAAASAPHVLGRRNLCHHWKHSGEGGFLLVLLADFSHVCGELVEQVVDDLGGEDLDIEFLRVVRTLLRQLHIKRQDGRELWLVLLHNGCFNHVLFVDRADIDRGDRYLRCLQEL